MPKKRLTVPALRAIPLADPGQRVTYVDRWMEGLLLRVGSRDRVWYYKTRFNGRQRLKRLGRLDVTGKTGLTRAQAKERAEQVDNWIENGIDPAPRKFKTAEKKPTTKNENAFGALVPKFLATYEKKVRPATFKQARRLLTNDVLAGWVDTDVAKLKRADAVDALDAMADRPVFANRLLAYLKLFFDWCVDRELVNGSPVAGMKKPNPETSRERVLNVAEMRKLWAACLDLAYPFGHCFRFMLVTGQRESECGGIRDDELDGDDWVIPGERTKNKRTHRVPLPALGLRLLADLPNFDGPFLFSTKAGERPISGWSKAKAELDKALDIPHWTPHDLRRTVNTEMRRLRIDPHVVSAVHNHVSGFRTGMGKVYDQYDYYDEKRRALALWADRLALIVGSDGVTLASFAEAAT